MKISALTPFVAEVTDLDITADSLAENREDLRDAIDTFGVMVVRTTAQDDQAFIRYCELFGELQRSTSKLRDPDSTKDDRLVDISNVSDDGHIAAADSIQRTIMLGARWWHTDNSFRNPAALYTILAARVVATEGGETAFRDMRAAHEALSADRQHTIDELVAVHDFDFSRRLAGGPPMSEREKASLPPVEHPLVRVHPVTQRKAIYAGAHACRIVGMTEREGQELLVELHEHSLDRDFRYDHSWQPGDILMWDNRSVQHRQMPYPDNDIPRVMRRATITDVPTHAPVPA